jgi:hypothetical protein
MFGQGIEALALFGGKPFGQPAVRLSACPVTQINTKPFQRRG